MLPPTGFLRLCQLLGDSKADPPVPPIIPVSKTTWWDGVRTGRFPRPVKLGPRTTAWPRWTGQNRPVVDGSKPATTEGWPRQADVTSGAPRRASRCGPWCASCGART